jgi:hypothetical protein
VVRRLAADLVGVLPGDADMMNTPRQYVSAVDTADYQHRTVAVDRERHTAARSVGVLHRVAPGMYVTGGRDFTVSYRPWIDPATPWLVVDRRLYGKVPPVQVHSLAEARRYVKDAYKVAQ